MNRSLQGIQSLVVLVLIVAGSACSAEDLPAAPSNPDATPLSQSATNLLTPAPTVQSAQKTPAANFGTAEFGIGIGNSNVEAGSLESTGSVTRISLPAALVTRPLLTNELVGPSPSRSASKLAESKVLRELQTNLEDALKLVQSNPRKAEPLLIDLLQRSLPESIQQSALLGLALAAQDENDLPRAQQIYAQFLSRWPNAPSIPEILLRQGRLYREMGLNNLALAKFYSVMTSSLVLKNDALDYYQRVVLLAQTEIAETHFQLGRYAEAADFLSRLLKQNNPALNRVSTQFKLVKACSALGRNDETITQAQAFLANFPDASEGAETRFHLALALKRLGRNNEALQQVLALLQEQKQRRSENPQLWAYWQQRAGNEIGNQLYREGDYSKALGIYLSVAKLDSRPDWQLPVTYQVGLTYERLAQPEKALRSYQSILDRQAELGTNAAPGLKAVIEMARWRVGYVQWHSQAETRVQAIDAVDPKRASTLSNGTTGS